MLIECPSCSARYKLADSKIKEKGTKVRCPKCTHTFYVYPEKKEAPAAENSDIYDEKTMVSRSAPPPPKPTPPSPPPPPTPPEEKREEKPKPVSKPAQVSEEAFPSSSPEEDTFQNEDQPLFEQREDEGEIKAFGDATLFEIQRASKKKSPKKWIGKAAVVAGVLVTGALGFRFLWPLIQDFEFSLPERSQEEVAESIIEIPRPSGWYRDDPEVYQQALVQVATLPEQEQARPANRALLAEALIANGLLVGAPEQVSQGLSYLPDLVLDYPNSAAGLYGTAAFAFWSEESSSVDNLLRRWPENEKSAPEYKLLRIMDLEDEGQIEQALSEGAALLAEKPNFQRATNYMFRMFLRHPEQSQQILSEDQRKKAQNLYERHRELLRSQIETLPPVHQEIERLLGNTEAAAAKTPEKKNEELEEEPLPVVEEPENVEPKPAPPRNNQSATRRPTRLPQPSQALVSASRDLATARTQARRLLEQGNSQFSAGNTDAALEFYRQALQKDESLPETWRQKGRIHMQRDETQRALRSFKMYLLLNPRADDRAQVESWIESLQ